MSIRTATSVQLCKSKQVAGCGPSRSWRAKARQAGQLGTLQNPALDCSWTMKTHRDRSGKRRKGELPSSDLPVGATLRPAHASFHHVEAAVRQWGIELSAGHACMVDKTLDPARLPCMLG